VSYSELTTTGRTQTLTAGIIDQRNIKACPHWQQIVAENGNKSATICCQCGQALMQFHGRLSLACRFSIKTSAGLFYTQAQQT